jgi:putative thioredoxin
MSDTVFEVRESTFESDVLERSRTVPVVVDFWAPWCGPCRTLGPVLEELARDAKGSWILAKVNADESPELARAHGVRGIPAVKAFVDGRVVDEFTGALPRAQIEEFLARVAPSRVDRVARQAVEAGENGDRGRERELWSAVLEEDPRHALGRIRRARLLLSDGRIEDATADLEAVPADSELHQDAANLLQLSEWARRVGDRNLDAVREKAATDPDNVGARYDLGCALAVGGDFEGALAEFLEVVRRDRGFENDAGRVGMLSLFALLGDDHELTREFRGQLSSLLF